MRKQFNTDVVPMSPNLLSQAVEANGLIFTSGQIHMNEKFELVGGSISEKTRKVFSNLTSVLHEAGVTFADVIKVTVYIRDMDDYKEFNDVYLEYFKSPMPAREVVEVSKLPMDADLEVSLVAVKG